MLAGPRRVQYLPIICRTMGKSAPRGSDIRAARSVECGNYARYVLEGPNCKIEFGEWQRRQARFVPKTSATCRPKLWPARQRHGIWLKDYGAKYLSDSCVARVESVIELNSERPREDLLPMTKADNVAPLP